MSAPSTIDLTPLQESDLPVLYRWINDREQVLLNGPYRPISPAQHQRWFEDIQRQTDVVIFAIRLQPSQELIGSCQLRGINLVHRTAELQIRIGDVSARGRGYGTEAVQRLVAFGFRDLNLHRISLTVFSHNAAAQRVYEKAGFVREGLLKQAAFIDGNHVDLVVMAIVND